MKTLQVELGERSYPIHIGPGIISRGDLISPHIRGRQVMVVTNEVVAPRYLDRLLESLDGFETHTMVLPDGETTKTLSTAETVIEKLLVSACDRSVTLIALGGGVIGDLTGFVAGCYQRGVPFIQIPTTLLAQVDSSVGGKTAVNSRLGKNMIGLFYQPRCVIADSELLRTLPSRELSAGASEVIKTALIRDAGLFSWLEQHIGDLLALEPAVVTEAVERCCRIKADVVAEDEREQGARALLNLGHTFGHAIETGLGHGTWLHGEAVAAGICMAADLSVRSALLDDASRQRIEKLIEAAHLPARGPASLSSSRFRELMKVDKKAVGGVVRLVLLKSIGAAFVSDDYDDGALSATLSAMRDSTS